MLPSVRHHSFSVRRTPMFITSNSYPDPLQPLHTYEREFYIYGSVRRKSILIRSNKMQQYAGIYLLQNHSTCFGCPSHPSSGVHKTVTAASGTDHSI